MPEKFFIEELKQLAKVYEKDAKAYRKEDETISAEIQSEFSVFIDMLIDIISDYSKSKEVNSPQNSLDTL